MTGVEGFVGGAVGLVLSLFAPLANTALVAPSAGVIDCSIWVSQSGINAGSAAQLTWWSLNATGAQLTESGSSAVAVPLSGSRVVSPSGTHTYSLRVWNNSGQQKVCSVSLSVSAATAQTPTCTLSAAPGTHVAGQAVRLFWVSQNATGAYISSVGTIPSTQLSQGSIDVYPQQSTLYTMTVGNTSQQSRTCSALITLAPRTTTTGTTYTPSTYTTSSYAPTTYSAPTYRTVTVPQSYSAPTYRTATTPQSYASASPLYTSGWYPQSSGSSYSGSSMYYSPSYSYDWYQPTNSGLGDYTLTNMWNDFGTGEYLRLDQSCSDYYGCDSQPDSWIYTTPTIDGYSETRYGYYDEYGHPSQATFDNQGSLVGYGREISNDAFNNTPSDGTGGWYDAGTSDSYYPQTYYPDTGSVYVPGTQFDDANYNAGYDIYSNSGMGPMDYYQSVPQDWSSVSQPSDPQWYQWEPNGWNGGSDPYQSGVYNDGSFENTWDYQI